MRLQYFLYQIIKRGDCLKRDNFPHLAGVFHPTFNLTFKFVHKPFYEFTLGISPQKSQKGLFLFFYPPLNKLITYTYKFILVSKLHHVNKLTCYLSWVKNLQDNQKQQGHSDAAILILSYLVKHPDAKDTLEGIARWWILREQIEQSMEKVSQTLADLVAQEFIVIKKYYNQEKMYQLNLEKIPDIKAILAQVSD